MTRALAICAFSAALLPACDPSEEPADEPRAATFEAVFEVFDRSGCATAGCHGGDTIAAELDLDGPTIAHEQLVDVQCANAEADSAGLLRVRSGDSGASFLLTKLAMTTADPTLGLPMPPSGDLLTAEELDLVRRWIDDGAPGPELD